jgi:peptidoglycan lytic transglycosylase
MGGPAVCDPFPLQWRNAWLGVALLALGACSTLSQQGGGGAAREVQDGPPPFQRDLSMIPEPVPHWEPLSPYGNPPFYEVDGRRYWVLPTAAGYRARGIASWYGWKFQDKRTSSGEPYDVWGMTAAHRTLPIPCYLKVTNLANGRSTVVRVNDRGPFKPGRLIDLSYAAAAKLGVFPDGTAPVEVRVVTSPETAPQAPEAVPERISDGDRIYLQAGAFSSLENAQRLETRLRGANIEPVRIEQVAGQTGTLFRVRVGPISDSANADRYLRNIVRLGLPVPRTVVD